MSALPIHADRDQSFSEEVANSVSHGVGLVAGLIGIPFLIVQAVHDGDAASILGVSLFCVAIVTLYLASTLYHALPLGKAKRVFRVLDHASIYILIAGTYSPFTLGILRGNWGWTLFATVWVLAVIGVALKASGRAKHPVISTGLYLLMGWIVIIAAKPVIAVLPISGLYWLAAGGAFYTVGVVFFSFDARLRFGHLIWHMFVLAGSVCHFLAVLWYAA